MNNPFIVGRTAKGTALVDRETELEKIKATLKSGDKLFLIGPRRYGKTSILETAAEQLNAAGAHILLYSVQGYTSLDLLVRALVTDAANFSGNLKHATESVKKFFTSLNPSVSLDPTSGSLSVSLGVKHHEMSEQSLLLIDALNSLERLAASSKKKVGLVLDEFQYLLELGGSRIEGQLRAAVQSHARVGYVFAGSQTSLLTDMISNHARPFYRLGEPLFLQEIPRADFLSHLRAGFQLIKCQARDETFNHLLDLAEDVPYHVQLLARTCWDLVYRQGRNKLRTEDVDTAHGQLIKVFDPVFSSQWAALTAIQRKVLALVAQGVAQGLHSKQTLRKADVTAGAMHKALQALERQAILRAENRAGESRHRFEDPLFKSWIVASTVSA